MSKKVLIFSLAYPPFVGGAEIAIKEITDRIGDFQFDLITLRFDSSLPRFETLGNVNVYRIGFTKKNPQMSDLVKFPLRLNKFLFPLTAYHKSCQLEQKNNYDLIWAMMAAYAGFGALFFKLTYPKIPYLLTLQEGDPIEYIKKKVRFVYRLFTKIFTKADFIQAISTYLANWGREMGFRGSVEVVPNAVDVAYFSQEFSVEELEVLKNKLGKKSIDKYVITTSRLVAKNAVGDVIDALRYLPENVKFLILGVGPLEDELKSQVSKFNLQDRVLFLGHIDHKELPRYLKISDVFIRPSLSEGMGNSFIEAMAAGIPVVATAVGGIPDFLFDPTQTPERPPTGLFCEVGNPQSIAKKIKTFLEDQELKEKIITNAKISVERTYNWDLVALKIKKIFLNLGEKKQIIQKNPFGEIINLLYSKTRFIKYCTVGAIAAIVDFSFLYVLTEFVGIYYLISALTSFILSAATNFTLNKYWTFKNQNKAIAQQFTAFLFIVIIGLGFNLILMYILTEKLGLWYMLSKAIAIGIVLFWNYTGNKRFTFKT